MELKLTIENTNPTFVEKFNEYDDAISSLEEDIKKLDGDIVRNGDIVKINETFNFTIIEVVTIEKKFLYVELIGAEYRSVQFDSMHQALMEMAKSINEYFESQQDNELVPLKDGVRFTDSYGYTLWEIIEL